MTPIEPLPSYWHGEKFRSRTEARWAVFFDAIGLRWEYEPQGYRLDDGTWYLPDFWLPGMRLWAEVKPETGPTEDEADRVGALVAGSGYGCLVLNGAPWPHPYPAAWPIESPGGPEAGWWWAEFADRYATTPNPRMFFTSPAAPPWTRPEPPYAWNETIDEAMATARRADVKDPDVRLPLGWEGIEITMGGVFLPASYWRR